MEANKSSSIIYLCSTSTSGIIWFDIVPEDKFTDRVSGLIQNGFANFGGFQYEYGIQTENAEQKYFCLCNLFSRWRISNTNLFLEDLSVLKELLSYFEGEPVGYTSSEAEPDTSDTSLESPAAPVSHRAAPLRFCNLDIPGRQHSCIPEESGG